MVTTSKKWDDWSSYFIICDWLSWHPIYDFIGYIEFLTITNRNIICRTMHNSYQREEIHFGWHFLLQFLYWQFDSISFWNEIVEVLWCHGFTIQVTINCTNFSSKYCHMENVQEVPPICNSGFPRLSWHKVWRSESKIKTVFIARMMDWKQQEYSENIRKSFSRDPWNGFIF